MFWFIQDRSWDRVVVFDSINRISIILEKATLDIVRIKVTLQFQLRIVSKKNARYKKSNLSFDDDDDDCHILLGFEKCILH